MPNSRGERRNHGPAALGCVLAIGHFMGTTPDAGMDRLHDAPPGARDDAQTDEAEQSGARGGYMTNSVGGVLARDFVEPEPRQPEIRIGIQPVQ